MDWNQIGNALTTFMDRPRRNQAQPAQAAPTATPAPTSALPLPNVGTNALSTPQGQALNNFYNTAMYQFPLQQGLEAVNANYAGRGALQSGAAMKAIEQYGANSAAAGAMGDYFQLLGNQQGVGLNAASAQGGLASNYSSNLSGLGQNYANNAIGLNSNFANNVSGAYGNYGNALSQGALNVGNINSNAAIAHANNNNALIGGIGGSLGGLAGYYGATPGYGYGY
jgi:hypothetical protein